MISLKHDVMTVDILTMNSVCDLRYSAYDRELYDL